MGIVKMNNANTVQLEFKMKQLESDLSLFKKKLHRLPHCQQFI